MRRRQRNRASPAGVVLAGYFLALSACTSGSSSTGASQSTSSSVQVSPVVAKLTHLADLLGNEVHVTFTATYQRTATSPVMVEQSPPDRLFVAGPTTMLIARHHSFVCNTALARPVCIRYALGANEPALATMGVYFGSSVIQAIDGIKQRYLAGASMVIRFSTASFGGQPSQCLDWSFQGSTARLCATDSGVVACSKFGGSGFALARYSASAPRNDFVLPKRAKIEAGHPRPGRHRGHGQGQ